MEAYDCIIIGGGPAGLSAAVYLARENLNILILCKLLGGQVAWSGDVENYLGFKKLKGSELVEKFEEHIKNYQNIDLQENATVSKIEKQTNKFKVTSTVGTFEAKSVLIASGKTPRKLNAKGETEFANKGVSYCAVCDGPLYKGKTVAVIGGGNSALDAAANLLNIAKKIYIVNLTNEVKGETTLKMQVEKGITEGKIEVLNNSTVLEIIGKKFVEKIKISKTTEKSEGELSVDGIFVEIGSIPSVDFCDTVKKNQYNEIEIGKFNETNIEGIFAAGDVTEEVEKQAIVAAGEGAKAGIQAFNYLIKKGLTG